VNEPHDDIEDVAIARALGIEEGTEHLTVDDDAVREYGEVLANMPFDEVAPPAGLEDRVVAAAQAQRSGAAIDLDARRARNLKRSRVALLVAAAAAAIAVIAIVGATRDTSTGSPMATIREVGSATNARAEVDAILKQPGARTGTLNYVAGKVVVAPNGKGALYDLHTGGPVTIVVTTTNGNVVIGTGSPQYGYLPFAVNRPDLVRAVNVNSPGGSWFGSATLSP
jgi:hypothetical protein